ncbi:MAG: hypothetical protein Q8O67_11645 [Deltaproteobacteria bacterium]|nr:hypothetical protein [Deltaproteobacteria bacterium]
MALFRLFFAFSHALGSQRTLIRRLGGLALLLMGVHAAADVIDDLAYAALDSLDFYVDEAVASFLSWISAAGGLTPEGAVRGIEAFASFVDLAEKDWLAIRLAFVLEIVLDVLLLDLAWGTRDGASATLLDDMRLSVVRLREAFSAIDLERMFAPIALSAFVVGGAVLGGMALEQLARGLMQSIAPDLLVAGNIAAALALVVTAVLCWRFLPDLLQGTLLRAHGRGEAARERIAARRAKHTARFPKLAIVTDDLRRVLRGSWLLIAAFVALAGLFGADLTALVERLGAAP